MNTTQYQIDISTKGDQATVRRIGAVQDKLDATDRSAARLSSRLTRSLGQAFRSLPGAEFFMNPVVALTGGVGIVSKLGMEAEKTATAFRVLVGSESAAAKMLGEINSYADNTLWDRSTTQEATKTMLGFGVSASSVVDDLKMLGDVAMGDKNRLQQLALVFGQISAAGKLQGQDLLQLINAGYNPLLDISALTGKSVAQLKDEMSKGLVTFDMVRAAFQRATGEGGKFNNMTGQIAQTAYGAFEQLKGKLLGTLLELYNVIQPLVIPALTLLGRALDALSSAAQWVQRNFDTLAPVLAGITAAVAAYTVVTNAAAIAAKVASVATTVWTAAQKALNLVLTMNPVGLVIAGVAALVAAITVCWNKFAGFRAAVMATWDTLKGFGSIIKDYVIDRIKSLLSGIGQLASAIGKLFKGDFSGAWDSAKEAAANITGYNAASRAVGAARDLAGGFRGSYDEHLARERAKESISDPKAAAGTAPTASPVDGVSPSGGTAGSTPGAITAGGTRNTSIVLNIGKFFDDVNIMTTDGRDLRQLQQAVLESINRSLEIATSAAR